MRDGRYYVRSTIDINQRLRHHQGGHTYSTKHFGKLELVFKQEYRLLKEARYIERKLKKLRRKDYLDKIIKDKYIKINIPR